MCLHGRIGTGYGPDTFTHHLARSTGGFPAARTPLWWQQRSLGVAAAESTRAARLMLAADKKDWLIAAYRGHEQPERPILDLKSCEPAA
jgi:hypothetical protein